MHPCINYGVNIMPIYEYKCKQCEHKFESVEFSNDDKPKNCADCGSVEVNRVISVPSEPKFVGKGFYATDYKKTQS